MARALALASHGVSQCETVSAIPIELWRQLDKAPTLRTDANQWGEHGYLLVDGIVYEYTIDRKEQYDRLIDSQPVAQFIARCRDEDTRAWAEKHASETSSSAP